MSKKTARTRFHHLVLPEDQDFFELSFDSKHLKLDGVSTRRRWLVRSSVLEVICPMAVLTRKKGIRSLLHFFPDVFICMFIGGFL